MATVITSFPNFSHYLGTSTTTTTEPELPKKINTALVESPSDLVRDHASKQVMWNVAKIVAVLGFLTLATAAFVATSVYAPGYVLHASCAICISLPLVTDAYSHAHKKSLIHTQQVTKFNRIIEIQSELDKLDPNSLEFRFNWHGIYRTNIQDFDQLEGGFKNLTIGLATMLYLSERTQQLYQLYQQHRNNLEEVTDESSAFFRSEQVRTAYYEQRTALANYIHAGYIHGIIQRPFNTKSLDEIGSMSPMLSAEVAALCGRTERLPLFVFNKENITPIYESDLTLTHTSPSSSDLNILSDRLFAE